MVLLFWDPYNCHNIVGTPGANANLFTAPGSPRFATQPGSPKSPVGTGSPSGFRIGWAFE